MRLMRAFLLRIGGDRGVSVILSLGHENVDRSPDGSAIVEMPNTLVTYRPKGEPDRRSRAISRPSATRNTSEPSARHVILPCSVRAAATSSASSCSVVECAWVEHGSQHPSRPPRTLIGWPHSPSSPSSPSSSDIGWIPPGVGLPCRAWLPMPPRWSECRIRRRGPAHLAQEGSHLGSVTTGERLPC